MSGSGFGQDGPYKKAKVFDQVIQAQAGIGEIAYGSNETINFLVDFRQVTL